MSAFNIINLSNLLMLIGASCMFGVAFFLVWQAPRNRLNQLMTIWAMGVAVTLLVQLAGARYEQLGLDDPQFALNTTILWLACTQLTIYLLTTSLILYTEPWTPTIRRWCIGISSVLLPCVVFITGYGLQNSMYEASFDIISGVPSLTTYWTVFISGMSDSPLLDFSSLVAVVYAMSLTILAPFVVSQRETHKYIKLGVATLLVAAITIQIPAVFQSGFLALIIILPYLLIIYAIVDDQVFAPVKKMTEELKESKRELEVAYKTVEREVNKQTRELLHSLLREQELSQKLEVALVQEEKLSQLKSLIIDNVFHEFRTPLTIINNSAEMLNRFGDRIDEAKRKLYFSRISDQIFYIDDLLNDILLASRANSEGIQPQWQMIPFNELCSETVILWQSDFMNAGQLTFEFDPIDDRLVEIDRRLLEQIGLNLLSNAIKYSEPNSIVTVSFILAESIRLQVIDNGIGVLLEDQERIFELFERGQNIETRRGMGLGLYAAQQMAQAMGGRIRVESAGANQGSIFTVELPSKNRIIAEREEVLLTS